MSSGAKGLRRLESQLKLGAKGPQASARLEVPSVSPVMPRLGGGNWHLLISVMVWDSHGWLVTLRRSKELAIFLLIMLQEGYTGHASITGLHRTLGETPLTLCWVCAMSKPRRGGKLWGPMVKPGETSGPGGSEPEEPGGLSLTRQWLEVPVGSCLQLPREGRQSRKILFSPPMPGPDPLPCWSSGPLFVYFNYLTFLLSW